MVNGVEEPISKRRGGNTFDIVYRSMLLVICREYGGLPDCRTLTVGEIKFFYDALKPGLEHGN